MDRDFDAILHDRIEHGAPRRRLLVRDVIRDPLPRADLVLGRGVLMRLADEDVPRAIDGILRTRPLPAGGAAPLLSRCRRRSRCSVMQTASADGPARLLFGTSTTFGPTGAMNPDVPSRRTSAPGTAATRPSRPSMNWAAITSRAEAPPRLARLGRRSSPGEGSSLPLSALRMVLDDASAGSYWAMHPDGVLGRALVMPAPCTVTVPLRLETEVGFSARAMLLPHDWRDGRGAVKATVAVGAGDGRREELWSGVLRCADRRGRPRGHKVSCRLPAWSTSLQLTLHPGKTQHRAVARSLWLEPSIHDPHAIPIPAGRLNPSRPTPRGPPPVWAADLGPRRPFTIPLGDAR